MPLIKRLQTGAVVALVLAALIGGLQGASPASALVGDITTFQDPTGQYPVGFNSITAGSDGNVWFSTTSRESRFQEICDTDGFDRDSLGRLSPSGELTFFTEPDLDCPDGLTLGPDGNVWFTSEGTGDGYITPDGEVTLLNIAAAAFSVGPDGDMWYLGSTSQGSHRLVRIDTSGQVLADFPALSIDGDLVVGADGNFWYLARTGCNGKPAVVRQTPDGVATSFCDPEGVVVPFDPSYGGVITPGPNGTMWFNTWNGEDGVALIDTLDPNPTSTIRTVVATGRTVVSMVQGADGAVWVVYSSGAWVDRISPSGVISTFLSSSPHLAYTRDIAVGPDAAVWFAAFGDAQDPAPGGIGRVSLGSPGCNTAPQAAPFTDVADTAWYGDAVDWGACHGFAHPVTGTEFRPTRPMKRASLVQALWEMVDRPGATPGFASPTPHDFTDVPSYVWFNDALDWADQRHMFTTLPGGRFDYRRELRRGEFAGLLWRMVGSPPATGPSGYADVPPGAWYAPAVDWAAEHDLIVTGSATMLHPKKTVTRAQALEILYRLASDPTAWDEWDGGTVSACRFP